MAIALRELNVDGETVIVLGEDGGLVASQSEPGVWHLVSFEGGTPSCDCKGFQYRGICRHPKALNDARWERDRETPDAEYIAWLELHAFGSEVAASD
jgi:hypothetical protein